MNAVNELLRINQRILNHPPQGGLRTSDVFCVARTGQTVRFAPHQDVFPSLVLLMERFSELYENAILKDQIAEALSLFWLGFIAIHPFSNGNGRTGKEYLRLRAREKGMSLLSFSDLDQLLLQGKTQEDLSNLMKVFTKNLQPIKG